MSESHLNPGLISKNFAGLGQVSRKQLHQRAVELAIINGRTAHDITVSDRAQARRELSGAAGPDPRTAILEAAPEAERWDPVPGSAGRQAPESPDPEENDEGENESAQLVEDGVREAEHDQMLQAARAAGAGDRPKHPTGPR